MKSHPVLFALLVAGSSFLAAGCGSRGERSEPAMNEPARVETPSPSAVAVTGDDRTAATRIFETRCATCHGKDARGDGPGAGALNPKPRNFHDLEWQAATSDSVIETAIVYGGAAVGKSAAMVPNPDLQSKPGVVAALRDLVRSYRK